MTSGDVFDVIQEVGAPVVTTSEIAAALDGDPDDIEAALAELAGDGIGSRRLDPDTRVWYPAQWDDPIDREHVVCFPDERLIIIDNATQYTRAIVSQFAQLEASTGDGGYRYRIRPTDVWHAPFDTFEELDRARERVLGEVPAQLRDWLRDQWDRATKFRLETHPDGYTVLTAATPELMGNVARQVLDDEHLHGPMSDTESWVVEGSEAAIKRALLAEGFPVTDARELDPGTPVSFETEVTLRDYQEEWVTAFMEAESGVIVAPPGSGKTVAAVEIMQRVGGETLILVPSRELASQWRDVILAQTTLGQDQVGEYHGGQKDLRPVTIATYHIAAMERHRHLFDRRNWGLLITDEVQHIPADVFRRAADLQGRYRLGLTATPTREDDKEAQIFTLVGPPIPTDWAALMDAGHVLEPELQIRYLPWATGDDRAAYDHAEGHERRQHAAMNPAKLADIRQLLDEHAGEPVLIFVDWLDQGAAYADALDVPFVSGETPHAHRERLFADFRDGELETLIVSRVGDEGLDLPGASVAILASGLGGSRRQGTQRAGRTMRPAGGASVYVLVTRGTVEAEHGRDQLRFLRAKGLRVTETDVELPDAE